MRRHPEAAAILLAALTHAAAVAALVMAVLR